MLRKRADQQDEAPRQNAQMLHFHPSARTSYIKADSFEGIAYLVFFEVCGTDEAEVSQVGLEI